MGLLFHLPEVIAHSKKKNKILSNHRHFKPTYLSVTSMHTRLRKNIVLMHGGSAVEQPELLYVGWRGQGDGVIELMYRLSPRKRALLLHSLGESNNDVFVTLPNTKAGDTEDAFQKAVDALTAYFAAPQQNREYEVYKFRQAKQEPHEDITKFYTSLSNTIPVNSRMKTEKSRPK